MRRMNVGSPARRLAQAAIAALVAGLWAMPALAAPEVELQPGTKGCTGVLPSNDGNTDMRVIGGTMIPGGTAIFEITYPLTASSVGKEFTILDCAYINDVAELKYIISFVPSNQAYVLQIALAIPDDAPVGGLYCNYVKTTASPTAAQGSQRKAGPACFVIRRPPGTFNAPIPPGAPAPPGGPPPSDPSVDDPGLPLLPNTALPAGSPCGELGASSYGGDPPACVVATKRYPWPGTVAM
jgi:hypothetical protein